MHINNYFHHGAEMNTHFLVTRLILSLPFIIAFIIYLNAVILVDLRKSSWRLTLLILWIAGVSCALVAIAGPLAARSHQDFTAHMLSHLLLGMLAPLLMVLARPMTLILRTLNVNQARYLSYFLKSTPIRFMRSPIVASLLNIGGLWVLYTTSLYQTMQHNVLVHIVVHLHVFLAGYLFTGAFIYTDPQPHRTSYHHRSRVLLIALACHGILSKYIYAHPPMGVPSVQAKTGGLLMYYGGDAIDLILITLLCYQWYKCTWPRTIEFFKELSK